MQLTKAGFLTQRIPCSLIRMSTATLEGELRFTHSRLLEAAEEIALYHGEETEKNIIERGYFALIKHINRVLRIRVWHGMAEEGVVKWLWGALGLGICAIPVFGGEVLGMKSGNLGSRMEGQWRICRQVRQTKQLSRLCDESKTVVVR
jgi:ABC-type uncharacterized transport system fused permease/ATPase subunit